MSGYLEGSIQYTKRFGGELFLSSIVGAVGIAALNVAAGTWHEAFDYFNADEAFTAKGIMQEVIHHPYFNLANPGWKELAGFLAPIAVVEIARNARGGHGGHGDHGHH